MFLGVTVFGVISVASIAAQGGPPQGIYACHVYSFGQQVLARQIKIWSNGNYEHVPIMASGRSDWGAPGRGRYTLAGDGAPVFQDGPLQASKIAGYAFDGKSSRFSLQGPADSRPTSCFGPAYHVDLK
jgi:hypothetical protein